MSLELSPRQMAARLASALELVRPQLPTDDAVREVLSEYQKWAGIIATPGIGNAMKDKAHVLDAAISWSAARVAEGTAEPAWVISARELIARYAPDGMLEAEANLIPAADIERMSAVMWAAVDASGFARGGPTDSRAAEDGEPIWVCRVRELASARSVPRTADGHEMPGYYPARELTDADLDDPGDTDEKRESLIAEYAAWNAEQGLNLGSADEHLFDSKLTLEQLAWVHDFVNRWEINEAIEQSLSSRPTL
ncbi:hypothetical protein LMG667_03395 [Xanthomonas euvesicatoria]|uniref:hypothetical protein n=1 Tax=Xanthomonas euvesicatoria TaxID=456327 RepID=UPI00080E6A1D|nr:hypothetical protein [Xanthomonas euvesicatoria]OCG90029.1 hypothetical protein LMG667_03395 [Xanthomonas euvesicatoria]